MTPGTAAEKPARLLITPPPGSGADLTHALIRQAFQAHRRHADAELIGWLLAHPEAPEDLLLELCDRGEYLDDLGHRTGPPRLLEKLAAQHRYPEAILTLGKGLYTDPAEPAAKLHAFLIEYRDLPWLFESLAHASARPPEKEEVLLNVADQLPVGDAVRAVLEERRLEQHARDTSDPAEAERLYRLGRPQLWRALAGNPNTPEPLLQALREVRGVKFARETRTRAQENLDRRSRR
jgi:hypothetical protein